MQSDEKRTGVRARKTEAGMLGQPTQGCVLGLSTAMGNYDQVLLGPSENHVDVIDIMLLGTVHHVLGGVAFPTHSHPPTGEGFLRSNSLLVPGVHMHEYRAGPCKCPSQGVLGTPEQAGTAEMTSQSTAVTGEKAG